MLTVEVLNKGKPSLVSVILIAKQTLYMRVPWLDCVVALGCLSSDVVSLPGGLVVSHSMGVDIVTGLTRHHRIWD